MTDSNTLSAGAATSEGFRAMMRGFPTGVAIVTATDPSGQPWGMTCSSLCSVTLQPPTLLVCLCASSPTLAAIMLGGTFALNLLSEGAQATAELFASGDPDRFDHVKWHLDPDTAGPHLREDAHAVADCRVGTTLPIGDHVVVLGETLRVTSWENCRPLVHGMRRYSGWPAE